MSHRGFDASPALGRDERSAAISFGHYRLTDLLGRGGVGDVWRAHDTRTDRIVAVKLLPRKLAHDDIFKQRFRREARAAAQLNEPHVVPIHGYGEIDGQLYVDMRLIEGRDLHDLLATGPLKPARAVMIIEQVAQALQAAHNVGLVHRDVKQSNILVADYDFAYLIDFGIARASAPRTSYYKPPTTTLPRRDRSGVGGSTGTPSQNPPPSGSKAPDPTAPSPKPPQKPL